jgi:hypothetical protein
MLNSQGWKLLWPLSKTRGIAGTDNVHASRHYWPRGSAFAQAGLISTVAPVTFRDAATLLVGRSPTEAVEAARAVGSLPLWAIDEAMEDPRTGAITTKRTAAADFPIPSGAGERQAGEHEDSEEGGAHPVISIWCSAGYAASDLDQLPFRS